MTLDFTQIATPVGPLGLLAEGDALLGLTLDGGSGDAHPVFRHVARRLGTFTLRRVDDAGGAATRLRRYFAGELGVFEEQPVRLLGSAFQIEVWEALRRIPAGTTRSYSELARAIGRESAVRAVAAANGANPIALFVPCHRVIAADGTLWGYGGGLPMKEWLLRHEKATFKPLPAQESLALEPPSPRRSAGARAVSSHV